MYRYIYPYTYTYIYVYLCVRMYVCVCVFVCVNIFDILKLLLQKNPTTIDKVLLAQPLKPFHASGRKSLLVV